jgi:hypothetical protein
VIAGWHLRWASEGVDDWDKSASFDADASPHRVDSATSLIGGDALLPWNCARPSSAIALFDYELVRPDGLFALRAHPFGAALRAFSAEAALCSRRRRSSSATLRTAVALRTTASKSTFGRLVEPACCLSAVRIVPTMIARYRQMAVEPRDQCGAPGRIRTADTRVRSAVLYPAELRAHFFKLVTLWSLRTLRGCRSLYKSLIQKQNPPDSNQNLTGSKPGALSS